ncbi:MAG: hypothetical protein QXM46_01040 [Candidatus Hadarchaeales archaeon]
MGVHSENLRRILSPSSHEDFLRRLGGRLELREEIASIFRDLNPPGTEHFMPEGWVVNPWMVNWLRERKSLGLQECYRMQYETLVEYAYREQDAIRMSQKLEGVPQEEFIEAKRLCYSGQPPVYLVRPELGFASTVLLYGRHVTVVYAHPNFWTGEFEALHGYHVEEGVPAQCWLVGVTKEIYEHFDLEDREKLATSSELVSAPDDPTYVLERREPTTGLKMRELPRGCPYDTKEWLRPLRDMLLDLRWEKFQKWVHADLYVAISPGNLGTSTQQNFWAISQFWGDPWLSFNAELWGIPFSPFTYSPFPAQLEEMRKLPREVWLRRMAELFLLGPKGMLCDAVTKLVTSKRKTPLLHGIRDLLLEGKMYKGFAAPFDDGIPPPRALLTAIPPGVNYREARMDQLLSDASQLPKEYRELLESEAGVDFKTGRIPLYEEVPRLKWLFDPTIEWLKPKDFPPIDWSKGQVWPLDVTREKMEIMVEEGYDGSGKDILHYSCLADRKMGQYGKTIMLGTMPYKLPEE